VTTTRSTTIPPIRNPGGHPRRDGEEPPPDAGTLPILTSRFGGIAVEYDSSVITPRPWTLLQSLWAAEPCDEVGHGRILELCCGVGHIGLVAAMLTGRSLLQVDLDPRACAFARRNAQRVGVGDRNEVVQGSILDVTQLDERFPVVIADPPYLPTEDVMRFPSDPVGAIDGGADGLDLLADCLTAVDAVLARDGIALLQLRGVEQLQKLLVHVPAGLTVVEVREHDRDRAVVGLRRPVRVPAGDPAQDGRR